MWAWLPAPVLAWAAAWIRRASISIPATASPTNSDRFYSLPCSRYGAHQRFGFWPVMESIPAQAERWRRHLPLRFPLHDRSATFIPPPRFGSLRIPPEPWFHFNVTERPRYRRRYLPVDQRRPSSTNWRTETRPVHHINLEPCTRPHFDDVGRAHSMLTMCGARATGVLLATSARRRHL